VTQLFGSSGRENLYDGEQGTCPHIVQLGRRKDALGEDEEVSMARIIVRCKYTGHYVFTAINTEEAPAIAGGCISCPYCGTKHVWTVDVARFGDSSHEKPAKLIVRQAS
jgi:hypothetical protein